MSEAAVEEGRCSAGLRPGPGPGPGPGPILGLRWELDALVLELLDTLEALRERREALSGRVEQGWFSLSKARFSMGCKSVSALQYGAQMEPHVRVCVSEGPDGHLNFQIVRDDLGAPKVAAEPRHVEEIGPQDQEEVTGLRHRGRRPAGEAEVLQRPGPVKGPGGRDPLTWFGILVPQSLRQAQRSFQEGLALAGEVAALQNRVKAIRTQYCALLNQAHSWPYLSPPMEVVYPVLPLLHHLELTASQALTGPGFVLFVVLGLGWLGGVPGAAPLPERLALTAFFVGALLCLAFSCLFHILHCHSERLARAFSRLDYWGITLLTVGSLVPWLHYAFECAPCPRRLYQGLVCALGLAAARTAHGPCFSTPPYRAVRTVPLAPAVPRARRGCRRGASARLVPLARSQRHAGGHLRAGPRPLITLPAPPTSGGA
ncbi:coiled-coil domain-containing protein 115 isoform A [Alligator mississippiensis]|uniref:Vacuolar ATPase assembly protein VMA22 n=1 Tax=Alligator mississippiensis TaxID=8496 RepID=A0A151N2J8_ALLMI|nr:coiled-coil domain-containing protein 115 isoform A [Alligator mississippiensis]